MNISDGSVEGGILVMRGQHTIADVARAAGVGTWTIRRMERDHKIPDAVRDGLTQRRVWSDEQMAAVVEAVRRMSRHA